VYRDARTRELAEEGKTHREIADEVGVDYKTVGNVLGKNWKSIPKFPKPTAEGEPRPEWPRLRPRPNSGAALRAIMGLSVYAQLQYEPDL
jgi:hypothetical protein